MVSAKLALGKAAVGISISGKAASLCMVEGRGKAKVILATAPAARARATPKRKVPKTSLLCQPISGLIGLEHQHQTLMACFLKWTRQSLKV